MKININININQLLNSIPALDVLFQQPVRAQTAFRLKMLTKEVNGLLETFNQTRLALCSKYGTLTEDGTEFDFENADNKRKFEEEYQELLNADVELQFEPMSVSSLGDALLSPIHLESLEWLIIE